MPPRRRGLIILLLLALACYGVLLTLSDPAAVGSALTALPAWSLAVAALAATGSYLVRWWRWRLYLRSLGHRLPATFDLLSYIAGFAFTATPGKAGEAARAIWLKPHGVGLSDTAGSCVAERLLDLASIILIAALVAWPQRNYLWVLVSALSLLGIGFTGLRVGRRLGSWAGRALQSAGPRLARVLSGGERTLQTALRLLAGRNLLAGAALGTVGWLIEAAGFCFLVHIAGSAMPWTTAAGVYALGLLAGAVSFLPGGLIGTELTLVALLVHFGMPHQTAIAVTLAARVCTLWLSIALGLAALGGLQLKTTGYTTAGRGHGIATSGRTGA
ncbi:MAG: lysylphosphatidylglycerol synthase transmembrane domain-containing protein [Sinimarinibacterium sp.]|jgi:uncharacterized protein (TIRG00374 family)